MNFLKRLYQKYLIKKDKRIETNKDDDSKATPFHLFILVLAFGISLMLISHMFTTHQGANQASQSVFSQQKQTQSQLSNQKNTKNEIAAFKSKNANTPTSMKSYEQDYENRLKDILDQVKGISNVAVMVNLATSEQTIIDKDVTTKSNSTQETDSHNGQRKTTDTNHDEKTVLIGSGDSQKPITLGKQKPKVDGVLVVAQGADNVQVKSWIINAVSSVLDVPAYKVNVLPRKPKGE